MIIKKVRDGIRFIVLGCIIGKTVNFGMVILPLILDIAELISGSVIDV